LIAALVEAGSIQAGAVLTLDPQEGHHLEVRRAEPGARIRLMDGHGVVGVGTLSFGRKTAAVHVLDSIRHDRPAPLVLGVGAGDKDRFGLLVEKCAELGVTDLVPLMTERSANVATRIRPEHIDKLERRALEAIKQSGNPFAPRVHRPVPLLDYIAPVESDLKVVAEQSGARLGGMGPGVSVTCLVGPEGGWTDAELAAVHAEGFVPASFADFTLRFETAAVAAAIVLQQLRSGRPNSAMS
jgi:16S rRNA (uracil1498-N3)-methyltransferase